jgi:D-aminopeptidase
VVATDAPLDARQLARLAKRAMLGVARTGAVSHHGSGDVAIAFSTKNRIPHHPKQPLVQVTLLSDFWVDDLFEATADAAEEAVVNALLAAETTVGRDGNTAFALPHDRLRKILAKHQ